MNIKLNQELINRCNDNSQFSSGDVLEREAVRIFARFDSEFQKTEGLTEEQVDYIKSRKLDFKDLIEEAYNNQLQNRSNFVPWNVVGRANYPAAKMNKIADRNMSKSLEWSEKIKKFIENTRKGIKELTPLESVLDDYREGKWVYGEAVSSDDPHALEKLTAKAEYLTKYHDRMKSENKIARSEKKEHPFQAYMLSNNLASIKATQKRIEQLKSHKENQDIKGFEFAGGEVVANYDINRLQICFDEKPDEAARATLKRNGFRWSPREGAWQRQLTNNALYVAKRILLEGGN